MQGLQQLSARSRARPACSSGRVAAAPLPQQLLRPTTRRRALRVQASASAPNVLQKLGRVLREKAAGDLDRFVRGTTKTRERLGLVEELLTFWSLEDYETTLEELEEALIVGHGDGADGG
ncbi:chloroplast SRP receptor [Monoraphidium neglectum]|uniref:Chloroplast SRP receptor n=1 Tax=Monoraphidium neglectum TaxID=145388 RepID=A0A0D2LQX7_9CHLO|nr:chloroplast SRP receptor [Monoraphidium neglectum]KIY92346.1 chloroplast SRP receptor [Monoraphidium neglectum]|eukprot:XP_013891366.1 chloroplast SRP receptor [Monoraphidium neglectum]